MIGTRHAVIWGIAALLALGTVFGPLGAARAGEGKEAGGSRGAPAGSKGESARGSVDHPRVVMKTTLGTIVLELDRSRAPVTVENFLRYVREGFYDGTLFHRVIPGFMIQGGGMEPGMRRKETHPPIRNEAGNGLKNLAGTIAMARTSAVDSATSQFFINCNDNAFLDHRNETPRGYGYAVFGRVVEGMDVVRKIEKVPTGTRGPYRDVPLEDVRILSVSVEGP